MDYMISTLSSFDFLFFSVKRFGVNDFNVETCFSLTRNVNFLLDALKNKLGILIISCFSLSYVTSFCFC